MTAARQDEPQRNKAEPHGKQTANIEAGRKPGQPDTAKAAKSDPFLNAIGLEVRPGDPTGLKLAEAIISPTIPSTDIVATLNSKKSTIDMGPLDYYVAVGVAASKVSAGDLGEAERMLYAQAVALNTIFGELGSRFAKNFNGGGDYMQAAESYLKLAVKVQNQARMTLETLANIKNPSVVYARQANIANGPQQVNNVVPSRAPATEGQNPPSKLLGDQIETPMDTGAACSAVRENSHVEALGTQHRA